MAKNQSYYFSHDINASNDPKIAAMISELGMISYAWWWILIEKLAAADDYKLPLKKYTFVALDNELKMNNEQILIHYPDNVAFAKKFILDGLQLAGVLENDNRKFIGTMADEIITDTENYVILHISERMSIFL